MRAREVPVEIAFVPTWSGETVSCQSPKPGFGLHDLRFYVFDVALLDATGKVSPVKLTHDGAWQTEQVALLDFENGVDGCAGGTAGTHGELVGHVAAGDYVGLRFKLGVPFELNHANPAEADPPLNLGRLHWGWQAGYKFLRFEGAAGDRGIRFHLGSTGCEGTIGRIRSCARPNRAEIEIDGFRLGDSVDIDLDALIGGGNAGKTASCMSEPDDDGCAELFAAVGIDLATGKELPAQSLFQARSS
jgi:uncharacterized repeat protein (TIGR04052 family)